MKRFMMALAVCGMAATANAQQIEWGFKGGVNNSHLLYKSDDSDDRYEGTITGGQIGAVAQININSQFAIQPNLLFTLKGGRLLGFKFSTMNAELPINLLYRSQRFFIGGGPNLAYGISGKILDTPDGDLDLYDQDEAEEFTLKRFELGANFLMGYTLPNGISISANYTPGLFDIYKGNGGNEDIKARSRYFGFSIGYFFMP